MTSAIRSSGWNASRLATCWPRLSRPASGSSYAIAAALLLAVKVGLGARGVAAARDRDDDVLFGDQVLHGHVAVEGDDLGTPLVAELVHDRGQLVADDLALALGRGQDVVVVRDLRHELVVLIGDLLALQGGQLAELHVQDGLRLDLVDLQELHQAGLRLGRRRRPADQRDDLVDAVEGLEEAAQDVGALLGLAQQEARAADDDVDLVVDPVPDELGQAERARHALDQREHVRAEGLLQLRVLVEVVEDDLGDRVALEHDDEPLARTAGGFVADVGDPGDLPFLDLFRDLQREVVRVDLVGEFADDQARTALDLLDLDHGAHGDQAAARTVGVLAAPAADDQAVGREVRALAPGDARVEQVIVVRLVVREVPRDAGGHLPQGVRRDVGGHADRDPGRAVDQQVRETAGEYVGLLGAAVVVGREVDGLLLDVPQHLHGERRHAALGVPHGGGRVVAR